MGVRPLPHDWALCGGPRQHPEAELFLQGPLSVVVTYGGDPIPKSPFPVTVAPPLQLGKVKVQGLNSSEWWHCGNGGWGPREGSTLHVVYGGGGPGKGHLSIGSTLGEETLEGIFGSGDQPGGGTLNVGTLGEGTLGCGAQHGVRAHEGTDTACRGTWVGDTHPGYGVQLGYGGPQGWFGGHPSRRGLGPPVCGGNQI